ncbi:MAG: hypothetical protein KJZ87_03115 [Thermoguttaceae bacterium]|nr:hypothetical protein [Thermoguttaceae bacterium]
MSAPTNRREFLERAAATGAGLIAGAAAWHSSSRAQDAPVEEVRLLRAGAAAVDIDPREFPVRISGGFFEGRADAVRDSLFARALVLDDGSNRAAIVVVDNLMLPRELLDEAKRLAYETLRIPSNRVLIAATHSHSAPSVMRALGTGVDEAYTRFLPGRLVRAIEAAMQNLDRAQVGWTVVDAPDHTHCRRWILRPDKVRTDPFGEPSVRAHMHPGYQNPDFVGPSGPVDTGMTLLAVQTPDRRPIAVLANYSMHYFGAQPVSADYFGRFVRKLEEAIAVPGAPPPVAIMSQGTSGDLHWMDYSQPKKAIDIDIYAAELAAVAAEACRKIEYRDWAPVAIREARLILGRRLPGENRLAWARNVAAELEGKPPTTLPQLYALEQIYIHEHPEVELKLQALRVGELGMAAIPCEVFGITGLKLKEQSPLAPTFTFELANGAEGYIPPPEQHTLGGYTTWPARTAGLEVEAEPKIVETVLGLLEQVAGKPRRQLPDPRPEHAEKIAKANPAAWWRMREIAGRQAFDASGHGLHGTYEGGYALYLPGPGSEVEPAAHRAVHFAGGRMKAAVPGLTHAYRVEFWFWNGLPVEARAVTGYLFSRGPDMDKGALGDHLGIAGTHLSEIQGRLFLFNGNERNQIVAGKTAIPLRTWNHLQFTRQGKHVVVELNGQEEIAGELDITLPDGETPLFFGGRSDNLFNLEGRLADAAVYTVTG